MTASVESIRTATTTYGNFYYGQSSDVERTHSALVGYLFWIFGFTGAHRFFFGKPLTGALWFFTGGLLLVGWIVDVFFIQSMADQADRRYTDGRHDYNLAWLLLVFLGIFGAHRFYLGKYVTAVIYLLTGGLFGIGYVYDMLTLNEQIDALNDMA